jgi:hypothetical protein
MDLSTVQWDKVSSMDSSILSMLLINSRIDFRMKADDLKEDMNKYDLACIPQYNYDELVLHLMPIVLYQSEKHRMDDRDV